METNGCLTCWNILIRISNFKWSCDLSQFGQTTPNHDGQRNISETCVLLRAVRSRYLRHLGLQLLEAWRSVLPRRVCRGEMEKFSEMIKTEVRWRWLCRKWFPPLKLLLSPCLLGRVIRWDTALEPKHTRAHTHTHTHTHTEINDFRFTCSAQ